MNVQVSRRGGKENKDKSRGSARRSQITLQDDRELTYVEAMASNMETLGCVVGEVQTRLDE